MITKLRNHNQLNTCPFCGGESQLCVLEDENIPELEPIYFVQCYDCDARGPHRDNPFDAEKWWNRDYLQVAIKDRLEDAAATAEVMARGL